MNQEIVTSSQMIHSDQLITSKKHNKNKNKNKNNVPIFTPTITPVIHHSHYPTTEYTKNPTIHHTKSVNQEYIYEPVPLMPLNQTYVKDEPEPVQSMPLHGTNSFEIENIFYVRDDPIPVPPMLNNSISMSMNELSSNETNYTALSFILVISFVAIGFMTYKRYQKRFIYQRIPENDEFDI